MRKVAHDEFIGLYNAMHWYEVVISGLSRGSKYFATEVGDDVMVLQEWNNDFCTSTFVIPNAEIITDGEKYTVSKRGVEPVMEVAQTEEVQEEISLTDRFAAISRSVEDAGEPEEVAVEQPVEKPQPKPIPKTEPIITKGRQKVEDEKPARREEVVAAPKKQQPKFAPIDPEKRPVHKPAPKPEPPVDDFAGW